MTTEFQRKMKEQGRCIWCGVKVGAPGRVEYECAECARTQRDPTNKFLTGRSAGLRKFKKQMGDNPGRTDTPEVPYRHTDDNH